MAEFYISVLKYNIAEQIANMLNHYNRLLTLYTPELVLNGEEKYFIELDHEKVIACVAVRQQNEQITKLSHLCVVPEKRNRGIAKKLLNFAIQQCKTPYVYGTVREDNHASLAVVKQLGFVYVSREWAKTHYLIMVGRRTQ